MAWADNRHSIFIGWAKVTLPLAALALLSTIFLFARQTGDTQRIPLSEIDAIAREPRISGPTFAGVAADGSVLSLRATELRPIPGRDDSFEMSGAELDVTALDGSRIELRAEAGEIDSAGRMVVLTDRVRLTTSTGFAVETDHLRADLRAGTVESVGDLAIRAPFGSLEAGRLRLETDPEGRRLRLLFDGGVRLLYDPDI